MAGYPPFEHAAKTDKWYKPLMEGDIDRFWKWHQKSPIAQKPDAKDLLQRMLCFDPKKRIDMNGIKNHKWMKGETLKQKELIGAVHDAQRKAEKKRRRDVRKMNDLAQTLLPCTRIPGIEKRTPELFPEGYSESMFREAYTYLGYKQKWYDLIKLIEEAITGKGKGKATLKYDENILNCKMTVLGADMDIVQFDAEIFLSRVWKDRYLEREEAEEIADKNEHQIFVIRITRTEGDSLVFNKLKTGFMLTYCSSIIKGVPQWVRKIEEEEAKQANAASKKDDEDQKEPEMADEYSKELGDIFKDDNKGGMKAPVKVVAVQT
eukprot:771277_1